jgi:glycyl-tRNA synthetase
MAESGQMDKLVALCKRRGFVYPASEIYGGINGFWDFGPLGVQLKNNIRDAWWREMVETPPIGPDGHPLQIVGLDSAIIQNPKTWVASGHVGGFNDPMVDCRETKHRYRADHLKCAEIIVERKGEKHHLGWLAVIEGDTAAADFEKKAGKIVKKTGGGELIAPGYDDFHLYTNLRPETQASLIGPDTNTPGTLTEPRMFNMMFETVVGAIQNEDSKAYLRPETAQGIFLNYRNVLDTMRVKMPFGVAQIGKAFRNEITPRNFIFRSREFEQMEMEWFCHPDDSQMWFEFWKHRRMQWWENLGIKAENLLFRDHEEDELAHYSDACVDLEYKYPFTDPNYGELEGIAHRGCFDLTQHQEHTSTKMEYFDAERNERYIPHVIEPAGGLTRGVLVMLCEAYTPDENRPSKVYMNFTPAMAPIKAAVLPLVAKEGMPEVAEKLYLDLRRKFVVNLDIKQNIGKRYARMDEIGTPYCFTIDGQTLEDQTVTVRYRDTLQQERIQIDRVEQFLAEKIGLAD